MSIASSVPRGTIDLGLALREMSSNDGLVTFVSPALDVEVTLASSATLTTHTSKVTASSATALLSTATAFATGVSVHEDPQRPARVAAAAVAVVVVIAMLFYTLVLLALYEHNVAHPKSISEPLLRRIRHYLPCRYCSYLRANRASDEF